MSAAAWVFLILICGFVWGGFALLLGRALRSERWKGEHPDGAGVDRGGPGGGAR